MPKPFPKTQLLIFFTLLFVATIGWDLYLYTLPSHIQTANYLFNLVYGAPILILGLIILANIYRHQGGGELVRSLGYLALGAISFGLGLYTWAYFNLILKVAIPHPSVSDAFFIIYPFLLTIGTVQLLRFYTDRLNWKVALEAVGVFILVTTALYYSFLLPSFTPDLLAITKFIIFGILIGNILLLSVVYLIIRIGGGLIRWRLLLYGAAYLMVIAGLALVQFRTNNGSYWNGDISDLFLAAHVYLFCLATTYTMATAFGSPDTVTA